MAERSGRYTPRTSSGRGNSTNAVAGRAGVYSTDTVLKLADTMRSPHMEPLVKAREAQRWLMRCLTEEPGPTFGALLTDGKMATSSVLAALVDHHRIELLEWDDETGEGVFRVTLEEPA